MTENESAPTRHSLRVVVADDDPFTLSLVSEGLRAQGFDVLAATNVDDAWALVNNDDPHALVSDLNFEAGESGVPLLRRTHTEMPWIGLVVLTSHRSPELAVSDSADLPEGIVYLVKSQLKRTEDLAAAVHEAIAGPTPAASHASADDDTLWLTAAQAEALRMLASGASTKALADARGTTVRAAETMLARLYTALGLSGDDQSNSRVAAVKLWQQGRISVR
jgi:DNA-binding NarL/FixJ family response regulator